MTALAATYHEINLNAQPYPAFMLPQHGTGLSLFSAGFLGWNDVIHMARKEMRVDCVDTDGDKLWAMASLYPAGFAFHVEDAWEFANRALLEGRRWDAVTVDPFFGDAAEKAWETLYLWTSLARKLVTLTVRSNTKLNAPDGWEASFFPRSDRAAWLVLKRA